MLNLTAPRMDPLVDPVDPGQWINAAVLGPMNFQGDIGPALQQAINLKPRVVYLPWREQPYELRSTVNVTGPVQHIDFGFAQVRSNLDNRLTAGLVVNTDQVTLLDNVATNIWITSESKRAVLIRDVSAFGGYFEDPQGLGGALRRERRLAGRDHGGEWCPGVRAVGGPVLDDLAQQRWNALVSLVQRRGAVLAHQDEQWRAHRDPGRDPRQAHPVVPARPIQQHPRDGVRW